MKKIRYFIFGFVLLGWCWIVYAAPQYSVSTNKSSIQNGGSVSFSVSISNAASWHIKITSAGSTSGCSNEWADTTSDGEDGSKTFTTTCKATSTGTISFTASGDITSADGSKVTVSGSKSVTVTEAVAKTYSSVNTLSSLEVDGYELTPDFDPNVTEYTTTVPSGTTSAYIRITKKDSKSVASGWGDVELEEGANRFEITVKAENGNTKKYVVIINVLDTNPINVMVGDKSYSIVKNASLLQAPSGFTSTTIKISDTDIPALFNETINVYLVGLKDDEGNITLYIYNDGNYVLYDEINVNGLSFVVMSNDSTVDGYSEKKVININGKDYSAYVTENSDIVLLYGMNVNNGNKGWYYYDINEGTIQRYFSKGVENVEKSTDYSLFLIVLGVMVGVTLIVIIILLIILGSKDKKIKKLIGMVEGKRDGIDKGKNDNIVSDEEQKKKDDLDQRFLNMVYRDAESKKIGNELKKEKNIQDTNDYTIENEILGDTDIIEEVPDEKYKSKKKKNSSKKKSSSKSKKKG